MTDSLTLPRLELQRIRNSLQALYQAGEVAATNTSVYLNAKTALEVLDQALGQDTETQAAAKVSAGSVPVHKEFQLLAMSELFDFQEATGFDTAAEFKEAIRTGTWTPLSR